MDFDVILPDRVCARSGIFFEFIAKIIFRMLPPFQKPITFAMPKIKIG